MNWNEPAIRKMENKKMSATKATHTQGTQLAEDLNTAIDNVQHWTANEMREHLMYIQPDQKTQSLFNAAPDLLEACENRIKNCPYCMGNLNLECENCAEMKAAIRKARGEKV